MGAANLMMRLPASLSSLLILISAAVPLASAAGTVTDHSKCDCYLTNGTEARFFSHHEFFDFRSQSQYAGVPAVISEVNESATAPVTSDYFSSEEWTKMWIMSNWNNSNGARKDASVLMVNSPSNVYIEANADGGDSPQTWLTLRTQRLKDFQSAAEIESLSQGFQFLSVRMLARTIGAKGAITALFTYRRSDQLATVQEADLEVRTMDPDNLIHYTNQPSYTEDGQTLDGATENATLADGLKWSDWAVHRLDWTPTRNTWFVNGKQIAQISFQTPRDSSKIILNAWSDGGKWAGNMSVNSAAYLQIQWFEVVYNSTEAVEHGNKKKTRGLLEVDAEDGGHGFERLGERADSSSQGICKAICSVDETPTQGQPVMLWGSGARRLMEHAGLTGWIPSVMVLAMFALSAGI